MALSVSPVIWQYFIDKMFQNISNREKYKMIMANGMVFSRKDQHFVDLANHFKILIKFNWKLHLINANFSETI